MKLPKRIYVTVGKDGKDTYLLAGKTLEDALNGEGNNLVGFYDLVRTVKAGMVPKIFEA